MSRHAAVDEECCEEMERKYGWDLVRVEETSNPTLEVDCVFEGKTEFPKSYYDTDQKTTMRKYTIFRAEKRESGWKERKLQHTQGLTRILAEHLDSSNKPIPETGYRPTEFIRVDALHNPDEHGHSTHYRQGDWEVARVETYTPDVPMGEFDMVVICYCKYSPINAPLKPMPERQISADSFGGDARAYEQWLESQKEAASV